MSEWWTYSLSDFLLFSPRTYYRLFELYNLAIWPMQLAALAGGVAILALWRHGGRAHGRIIAGILAAVLAVGRLGLSARPLRHDQLGRPLFRDRLRAAGAAADLGRDCAQPAAASLVAAMPAAGSDLACSSLRSIVQPLIAPLLGRSWLQAEIFGVAPDPTVVATLGILHRRRPAALDPARDPAALVRDQRRDVVDHAIARRRRSAGRGGLDVRSPDFAAFGRTCTAPGLNAYSSSRPA